MMVEVQMELLTCRQGDDVRTFAEKIRKLECDLNNSCIADEGDNATKTILPINKKSAFKSFIVGLNKPLKIMSQGKSTTRFS